MSELKYARTHEWIRVEGSIAVVGLSEHAQRAMGDVTFVDVPIAGTIVQQGEPVCVVESIKAAVEVCAPVSGKLVEVNGMLPESPELINRDPLGTGWLFKMGGFDAEQFKMLLTEKEYIEFSGTIGD